MIAVKVISAVLAVNQSARATTHTQASLGTVRNATASAQNIAFPFQNR